ncbi:hypothetical protein RB614_02300 [Phytohabitans sp. ZYX-F-186]|uniref:Uncharacterized protein n=1 Tax=Phytohabitans maris TaxID=3071409 RepID=A0ABU0Z8F8_9ACTN|nr:hypothetical protein [Phytohabitans sp. ZYX-F-186]MDQ7903349.1 hypothetical protein [Phytohabitans sp. ZYX-F-186]
MAIRTWSRVLLAALGVAMLAAASQLGVAFGLGIVRLSRTFAVDQENQWTTQMAWVTWFAMVAAVAGAVAADRMARRRGYEGGTGSRIAYSVFGGIGAAVLVPLCMQPARFAIVRATDPVLVIGLSAALGAVAGVLVAVAALSHQPLLWNVGAVTAGAWVLALASVVPSLGPDDPLPNLRLGVLDLPSFSTGAAQSSAVVTMPLLALALGAATAGLGRWLGRPPVTIAASGIVGPAMLCLAYLVAGPGSETDKFQAAPYWGALVAVGAGTLGSVLATVARRPSLRPATPAGEPGAAPQEQTPPARPPREPAIQPVFREPPTGEWSVPLPRHSAKPSTSAADETTDPLPTIEPSTGRTGSASGGGGLFDEPTADLSPQSPPQIARPSPSPVRPARRRPPSGRDPGAAGAATAFSAGRRAAGYSTGELPVYTDDDRPSDRAGSAGGDRGRPAGGGPAGEEPTDRKARKRGKETPAAEEPTARQRRGLFGRRRAADPAPESPEPAGTLDVPTQRDLPTQRGDQPRPEPALKPRDEEYVDWVSGLSSRDADPHDKLR